MQRRPLPFIPIVDTRAFLEQQLGSQTVVATAFTRKNSYLNSIDMSFSSGLMKRRIAVRVDRKQVPLRGFLDQKLKVETAC